MWKASLVVVALGACSVLPLPNKQRGGSSSAPPAPGENELYWDRGAPLDTFPGFRSFASAQPFDGPVPPIDGACGAPAAAHVLTTEIERTAPDPETVYVTTHGIVVTAHGQVVAATEPVTDCSTLASEIVAAHAGFLYKNLSFPRNPHHLVVVERIGTQVRQRLFTHWPQGRLTESFSWIIADSSTPDVQRSMRVVREGEELHTESGAFHWVAAEARFVPGAVVKGSSPKGTKWW